jgi:hypothetical protein
MRVLRLLSAVLVVGGLAACADSTAPGTAPASIEIVAGDGQEALRYETLPDSLRVRVLDRDGNPLPRVRVDWTATSGAISPSSTESDDAGVAAASWSFYAAATGFSSLGSHHATATVEGAGSATFAGYVREGVVLRGVWITPDHVNVASSDASVTVSVWATDDRTTLGIAYGSVQFYNPTATSTDFESFFEALALSAGTPADGVWKATITVPQGAETGAWTLGRVTLGWGCGSARRVSYLDGQLQSLGMPYQLHVTAEPENEGAPLVLRGQTTPHAPAASAPLTLPHATNVAAQC